MNIGVIKKIATIGPPNYPEVTEGVFIIRAPWVFAAAWKVVSPLLPAATRQKVNIVGANYREVVGSKVPAEHLPRFLGGECTLVDEQHDDFEQIALPVPAGALAAVE